MKPHTKLTKKFKNIILNNTSHLDLVSGMHSQEGTFHMKMHSQLNNNQDHMESLVFYPYMDNSWKISITSHQMKSNTLLTH